MSYLYNSRNLNSILSDIARLMLGHNLIYINNDKVLHTRRKFIKIFLEVSSS